MTMMPQVRIGGMAAATSALVLGCSRLGSALAPLDRRQGASLIDEAFGLGVRHFDTASIYGQGDSERWLGETLRTRRGQVCLASKAGQLLSAKQALMARFKPLVRWLAAGRPTLHRQVGAQRALGVPRRFDAAFIERSLHASLRRLRTDHLDLFYLHSPAPEVLDDDALMTRLQRLREAGLFRVLGVSCDDAALVLAATRHPLVQLVQFDVRERLDTPALLQGLAAEGKQALLRGFIASDGVAELSERFGEALTLPALAGIVVGTTRVGHLHANVEAFEHAARARELAA